MNNFDSNLDSISVSTDVYKTNRLLFTIASIPHKYRVTTIQFVENLEEM
jgi:hypothetical protein